MPIKLSFLRNEYNVQSSPNVNEQRAQWSYVHTLHIPTKYYVTDYNSTTIRPPWTNHRPLHQYTSTYRIKASTEKNYNIKHAHTLYAYNEKSQQWNMCALREHSNLTVLETINLDHISEGWSC